MNENIFDKLDFGPLRSLLDNDDITDISFDNNGQIWVRSLTQGSLRVEIEGVTPEFIEKLAFQCSNVMGTTFNNAKPFLDAESSELRLNFVHQSIATNGIAMVIRKTPAKIRLEKEKLLKEEYFTQDIHDILIKCVEGHCNIIVCGETGSGKTEFVKYLASHTKTNEKIITIEDTLELHLDKIFPQRDIVAMKTNNVASYTDVLVTCMRQNPKWILLSEVRSAEAVSAVRNSISSGHNILSTIHADKASAIPYRLYSLMETDLDVNQFLNTIYRYIQLGVHIKAYYSKEKGRFQRELDEVVEFYVDENNEPQSHVIYQKQFGKEPFMAKPSPHLTEYLENQNIDINSITSHIKDVPFEQDSNSGIDNNVTQETSENESVQVIENPGLEVDAPVNLEQANVQLSTTDVQPELVNGSTLQSEPVLTINQQDVSLNPMEQVDVNTIANDVPQVNMKPIQPTIDNNPVLQTEPTEAVNQAVLSNPVPQPEISINNNEPEIQPGQQANLISLQSGDISNNVVSSSIDQQPPIENNSIAIDQATQNASPVIPINNDPSSDAGQVNSLINIPIIQQNSPASLDVSTSGDLDINGLASLDTQESS